MSSKLTRILFATALVLALAPWTTERASSQEKGAGVAGGSRVSRGSTHSSSKGSSGGHSTDRDESTKDLPGHYLREIASLEEQCLEEVNRVRRRNRLSRLNFSEELLPVAREYSRRIAEENFFSHSDPEGLTVRERVDGADIKWQMVGENLAYSNGYVNPVAASLHGWMDSPGHRRNILDPGFSLTAIGVWIKEDGTVYFTEIFLKQ